MPTDIEQLATANSLVFFGSSDLNLASESTALHLWLDSKKNASMTFLQKNTNLRLNPADIFEGAKSALVFGLNYNRGLKKSNLVTPQIAQYAVIKDYHRVISQKLALVAETLKVAGDVKDFVICVDTKPVLERALARKTGAGFIGKNTCFIHYKYGSYYLLGTIITDSEQLSINTEETTPKSSCGTCRRCQVYCPTGALNENYKLDSNLCLSYWTIENRGLIPFVFWKHLRSFWYGCDLCQMVCPFNRKAALSSEKKLALDQIPLIKIALMTQAEYEVFFAGTALTRAKIYGLQRNALIAMFVSDDPQTQKAATLALGSAFSVVSQTASEILQKMKEN